jgi:L-asparaginase
VTSCFCRHMHRLMSVTFVAGLLSFWETDVRAAGIQTKTKPKVLLIGTGGTIAGVVRNPGGSSYDPGKLTVEAILAAIPEVKEDIEIDGRQLADLEAATPDNPNGYINVASSFIRERHWLILARWAEQALERDGFDAVIVTHGTDTLDETAFFLQLTVKSSKPVIVVGSMRPSEGNPDPDGPDNLRSAFRLILDNHSHGKGVLVVSQFVALPAYDVMKVRTYPSNLPVKSDRLTVPFEAPNFGIIAAIEKTSGSYRNWPITWNPTNRLVAEDQKALDMKFDIENMTALPQVPILTQEVGNAAPELLRDYYLAAKPHIKSFVIAGEGNCAMTRQTRDYIASLSSRNDIAFVRSSRTGATFCYLRQDDLWPNAFGAATLSPQHLKILLQLLQATLESDKNPTGFREAVGDFLSKWIPYPNGMLPK